MVVFGHYSGSRGSLLGPYFIKSWVPIGSLFLSLEVPISFRNSGGVTSVPKSPGFRQIRLSRRAFEEKCPSNASIIVIWPAFLQSSARSKGTDSQIFPLILLDRFSYSYPGSINIEQQCCSHLSCRNQNTTPFWPILQQPTIISHNISPPTTYKYSL